MSGVLQRYGVDPRALSQEQLYKLALTLQLPQTQDKIGTLPDTYIMVKHLFLKKKDNNIAHQLPLCLVFPQIQWRKTSSSSKR